jgi:hypothetical protein
MEGMKEVRMTASGPYELVGEDATPEVKAEEAADWQQQQLLPEAGLSSAGSSRPSDRLRRAGLVGIAQAREALAEAARRAQARSESRAA